MYTQSVKLIFHIPYSHSLKEKRQVCRSLIDRVRQKFNVSVAEVDTQDAHQILTIGIAVVSESFTHGQNCLDKIVRYMETHTDAELTDVVEP
ncbi:MAG: DUF503 domain-containing protein [Firmicutes bacterium]|nr:DUF503 domain-containing protein [Bacillota bacterium]